MKLLTSATPTHEELKCYIALAAANTVYTVGPSDPKYASCGPQLLAADGTSVIFSANAIVRYVAAAKEALQYDDLAVDEWVEWESHVLSPWLTKAKKAKDKSGLLAELSALLEAKDAATRTPTTPIEYLFGSELTLADIVAAVTLRVALEVVPVSDKDTPILKTFRAYVTHVFTLEPFIKGEALLTSSVKGAKPAKAKGNTKTKDATAAPAKAQPKAVLSSAKPAPLLDTNVLSGHTSHNVLSLLESIFAHAIYASYPDIPLPPVEVTRTTVKNAHVGDYQCNSAMAIFGVLKGTPHAAKSPREVATSIINNIPQNPMIERLSLAGAGFINCFLTPAFLTTRILHILQDGVFPSPVKKQRIAVDFSSPNIAKDMHVGHLRSTIIGDTMCRLLEFQGHEVLRLNHVGDWGTQFGMLICHLMEAYPTWEYEMPDITDLTKLYKAAKLRFDEDEEFQKRSKHHVVLLQSGDAHCRKVWTTLCEISRREFQKVYTRLGVSLTEMGESFYNSIIPGVIDKVKAQGLTSDSDGAVVVFTDKFKHPFILVKGDGSYLYATTDMAALWYRLREMKADRILYYTDYSQNDHFKLLFEVGQMAKIYDPAIHRVDHVGFGTVNDESGQRFKTRSGDVVRLVDLLDEAKTRMKEQLLARIASGQTSMSIDQVEYAAERIGYGAVKYFDLRQCPTSSYIFSFDRMLSTTGDTAVYLMFAYARLCSIIRKSGIDIAELVKGSGKSSTELIQPVHATEQALALELLQLQDIILFVDKDLMSNRMCSYLYTLAERVQTFVTACRVIGSEEQTSRLLLCDATIKVMQTCFSLLGMEPLDQI